MSTRLASMAVLSLSLLLSPALAGCSAPADAAAEAPAQVEEIAGSEVKKVTLTEDASAAVGIKTAAVSAGPRPGQLTVPYSALIYYTDGTTWVYTAVGEREFVRVPVSVTSMSTDVATLTGGPKAGTSVVVVGATEVLGAELEIDGEQ